MNPKKLLMTVLSLVVSAAVVIWLMSNGISHIEDTNGPEDFSVQTITQQQISGSSIQSIGNVWVQRNPLFGDTVEFSSEKFTGVYEIFYDTFWDPSDFEVSLTSCEIQSGNFQVVVVHEDRIAAVLEPDALMEYRLEDVTGYVSLRIVGESAAFRLTMSEQAYDRHTHPQ